MAQYDGAVRVNTAIDTTGFDRGSKELQQATAKLQRKFESVGKQLEKSVGQYQKALMSGNAKDIQYFSGQLEQARNAAAQFGRELGKFKRATFQTDEYKKLQTNIEAAEKALLKLYDRQEKMEAGGVKESSKAYQSLQYDIARAEQRLKEAEGDMQSYLDSGGKAPFSGADTAQIKAFSSALRNVTDATSPVQLAVARVAAVAAQAGRNLLKMASASIINGFRLIGQSAAEAARQITKMTATAVSGGIKRLGAWLSSAAKSMTLFGRATKRNNNVLKKSFSTILKYGLGVRSFYFLFRKIRQAIGEGYQNLARYSDTLNASISGVISSFKRFENQFAASFEPLVNIVAPAITRMIDSLTEATFRAGEFIATLSGQKTVIRAKEVQEDYAESLDKTKKAAKEAERQLAGFDQLNILKKPDEDEETKPEDMFETVPVEDEAKDFADAVKEAWVNVDLSGIGDMIGGKLKVALDKIPWPDIKKAASDIGKRLATFLNGLINVPGLGKSLGKSIAEAINTAFAFLDGFVWRFDWKGLGNAIMDTVEAACDNLDWELINHALQGLAIGLAGLLNTIFSRVEVWEKIGVTIGRGINAAVNAGVTFLEEFDFNQAARAIVTGLNAAIAEIAWEEIGRLLADLFGGALQFIRTALLEFHWVELGEDFADGLNEFVQVMLDKILHFEWDKIGQGIADGVNAAVGRIGWNSLGTLIGWLIGGALKVAASFIRELDYDAIRKAVESFISSALRRIDYYDLLTVWGVAALIVAVKRLIAAHPVLALISAAVLALGPKLGGVIHKMVRDIPWEEVGQNLGQFLVNALNRLHEAIQSVNWFELGQAVGRFLGNINWSEIVNAVFKIISDLIVAGFKTLGGIIVGMGPQGILNALWALAKVVGAYIGGKTLLTVLLGGITTLLYRFAFATTSGISGIGVSIIGAIMSVAAKISPVLSSSIGSFTVLGNTLLSGMTAVFTTGALAAADALLLAYDVKKLQEAQQVYTDAWETHNRESKTALDNFAKLYEEKGSKVATQWAKTCYDIDVAGMGLEEAQTALVDRIDELWQDTPENLAQGFWQGLQYYWHEGIGKYLGDLVTSFLDFIKDLFGIHSPSTVMEEIGGNVAFGLFNGIAAAWQIITDFFGDALEGLKTMLGGAWDFISGAASDAWNGISTTLGGIVGGIATTIGDTWEKVKTTTGEKWNEVTSALGKTWESVKTAAGDKFKAVKETVSGAWDNIKTNASKSLGEVSKTVSGKWSAMKADASKAWDGLKTSVGQTLSGVKSESSSKIAEIVNDTKAKWDRVKADASNAWNGVKSSVVPKTQEIRSQVASAFTSLQGTLSSVWGSIRSAASGALSSVSATVGSMVSSISSKVSSIQSTVKNVTSATSDALSKTASQMDALAKKNASAAVKVGGLASGGFVLDGGQIHKYASGTARAAGSLFVAGEAGPEIVGHVNGRTEVLNQSQIAGAIYGAVLAAMGEAVKTFGGFLSQQMASNTNALITAIGQIQAPQQIAAPQDTTLTERLAALQAVPYQVPAYATGTVMPYEVVAEIRRQTSELKTAIYDEGEEIIQAIVSAISNHGLSITNAISRIPINQGQSYTPDDIGRSSVDYINRQTRMNGRSPLLS